MQAGIHALLADIAAYTGFTSVEMREYFKQQYWGDREGTFSLSLDKCEPYDAQLFYEVLAEFALRHEIELCTWSNERHKARGLL